MRPYLILLGLLLAVFIGLGAYKQFQPSGDRIADTAKQAIQKKDPTFCDVLSKRTEKPPGRGDGKGVPYVSYPRNQCLLTYLQATKDRQVCEMLDVQDNDASRGVKEYCYNFIADAYQDPTVCQKLDGTAHSWKSIPVCRAVAKRDVRECDILAKDEQDFHLQYSPKTDCILEVVRRTKDYTICAGITGPGYGSLDAEGADLDRNECLKIGGCDKPDRRQEICLLMKYPAWTLSEEKAQCATETWKCPDR